MEQQQMGYENQWANQPNGMPTGDNGGIPPQYSPQLPQYKLASCNARQCARFCDWCLLAIFASFMPYGLFFSIIPYLLLESAVYGIFGNTFGKWVCGIRVVDKNGIKLDGSEYFLRNCRFFLKGLWLGVPILFLVGIALSCDKMSKGKPTSYDAPHGISVVEYNRTPARAFISTVVTIGCLALLMLLNYMARQQPVA